MVPCVRNRTGKAREFGQSPGRFRGKPEPPGEDSLDRLFRMWGSESTSVISLVVLIHPEDLSLDSG